MVLESEMLKTVQVTKKRDGVNILDRVHAV